MNVTGSVSKFQAFENPVHIGRQVLDGNIHVVQAGQLESITQAKIDNFLLLVDTSGSMSGERIGFVKRVIKDSILPAITDGSNIILDTFDSDARSIGSSSEKVNIDQLLSEMKIGSGTNILAGVEKACEQITENDTAIEKPKKNVCMIFTDGDPRPITQIYRLFPKLKELREKNNCTIMIFGMGSKYKEGIVKLMAQEGIFWFHASPNFTDLEKLKDDLGKVFNDIQSSDYFISCNGTNLQSSYRIKPVINQITTELHRLRIGYTRDGAFICLAKDNPAFTLVQQNTAQEDTEGLSKNLQIEDFSSLPDIQKAEVQSLVLKWLISTIQQERDFIAQHEFEEAFSIKRKPDSGKDDSLGGSQTICIETNVQRTDYERSEVSQASLAIEGKDLVSETYNNLSAEEFLKGLKKFEQANHRRHSGQQKREQAEGKNDQTLVISSESPSSQHWLRKFWNRIKPW